MCVMRIGIALQEAGRGGRSTREEGEGGGVTFGLASTRTDSQPRLGTSGHLAKVFYLKAAMRKGFFLFCLLFESYD